MITIKQIEPFFWHNRFAPHPVLWVYADVSQYTGWRLGMLRESVKTMLCAKFPILKNADDNSSVTQCLSLMGMSTQREKFGVPHIIGHGENVFFFAGIDHFYAEAVARHSAGFLGYLLDNPTLDDAAISRSLEKLEANCEDAALDQSVRAIVLAAQKRGIPWFRMAPGLRDVQLGQGHLQKRMRETLSSEEHSLAISYSRDKVLTCTMLAALQLPVGQFAAAHTPDEAVNLAKAIGFPVVLKPLDRGKGVDVLIGLASAQAVHDAASKLLKRMPRLMVQSYLPGEDHRLLVVDGRFTAAAKREAACVTGDGAQTVAELIAQANRDPRRGKHFYRLMNLIVVDKELESILQQQGLTLGSITPEGKKIHLRLTANISTGGTATDMTDSIHPDNVSLAERAARAIGLKVAGIDFITPDISRSWREVGGGICEVNASVGLRPHWLANPKQDVVTPILNTVYAPGRNGRIPTVMVTGSNGKTTTTRMVDYIFRAAGHVSGCVTTDGITINGQILREDDVAGAGGASVVLRDATVTAAALETARGGLIKRGMYLQHCNVATLLNVDGDHIGLDGIETLDQMAQVKRNVLLTARQKIVLNAQDTRCLAMAKEFAPGFVVLFSLDAEHEALAAHRAAGGATITPEIHNGTETIIIRTQHDTVPVMAVKDVPATYDGVVRHNVANALAAVGLAYGMNMPVGIIARGLAAFTPSMDVSAGRFNIIDDLPAKVLFEFANNPPAIATAMPSISHFSKDSHSICALTCPGNRDDVQIAACAQEVAGKFDEYVCFERLEWLRGREPGTMSQLMADALLAAGVSADKIHRRLTQPEAMELAAKLSEKGGFIAVFGTDARAAHPQIRRAFDAVAA